MPSAEIFPTLKELTAMKLVKSQRTFDLTETELMKCLCPGVVRALRAEKKARRSVHARACISVLISFIYSSTGRSADASERERRDRSERQKV